MKHLECVVSLLLPPFEAADKVGPENDKQNMYYDYLYSISILLRVISS